MCIHQVHAIQTYQSICCFSSKQKKNGEERKRLKNQSKVFQWIFMYTCTLNKYAIQPFCYNFAAVLLSLF